MLHVLYIVLNKIKSELKTLPLYTVCSNPVCAVNKLHADTGPAHTADQISCPCSRDLPVIP